MNGIRTIVTVKGEHNHPAVLKRKKKDTFSESFKIEHDPMHLHADFDTDFMDEDLTV